jgi:translocation and assembly module TamA
LPTIESGTLTRKNSSLQQTLFGFSANVKMDLSNHYAYPSSGVIFDLNCQPYFGKFCKIIDKQSTESENVSAMAIFTGNIRTYFPLSKSLNYSSSVNSSVFASFISVGTIVIKDLEYIPFDKRFYGGGRNSIRAYGYQLCSSLDEEDKPIGGTSLFEFGLEPRIRISENWGMMAFFEMSSVGSKANSFSDCALYGIGAGIRYFTKFGPVRFDIGFPITRRKSQKNAGQTVDRSFQFYISVGQSF